MEDMFALLPEMYRTSLQNTRLGHLCMYMYT